MIEEQYKEFQPLPDAPIEAISGAALAVEPEEAYVRGSGRPQLHFSGLDKLWGCGEAFRRVYIERERPDGNIAMLVGTAVDFAVSANLESKMNDKALLDSAEVMQIARDKFEVEIRHRQIAYTKEQRLAGVDKVIAEAIDKTVRLTKLHCKELAPTINPTHVQRLFSITIAGFDFDLVGAIDIQEGSTRIRDTKAKAKSPSASEVDSTFQLTTYDLAVWVLDHVKLKEVTLDCLIDNKVPVAKVYRSTRDFDDYQALLNRIENAAHVIKTGAFMPARPTDWVCSRSFCAFFDTCRYVNHRKAVVIEAGE